MVKTAWQVWKIGARVLRILGGGFKLRVIGLVGVMRWSMAEGRGELKRVRVLLGEMGGRARGQ
jgi:hypothetical protein